MERAEGDIEKHAMAIGAVIRDLDRDASGGVFGPQYKRARTQIHGALNDIGKGLTMLSTLAKRIKTVGEETT